MIYPDEFSTEDLTDYFKESDILYDIVDDSNHNVKEIMIRNPIDRMKLALLAQRKYVVYTLVDLENGQVGYSKGVRYVNRINEGIYIVVRKEN